MVRTEHSQFGWKVAGPTCAHAYLLPTIMEIFDSLWMGKPVSVLEIGCGNGYVAAQLTKKGHIVTGIDVS